MLSKTLQRYENKSKSQLHCRMAFHWQSCLRLCKDTKIKANHNNGDTDDIVRMLSKTLQRYENKSKSQPGGSSKFSVYCCLRLCKDTKIKANHNAFQLGYASGLVV